MLNNIICNIFNTYLILRYDYTATNGLIHASENFDLLQRNTSRK